MSNLEAAFEKVMHSLQSLHPDLVQRLHRPASEAQIATFEQANGIRLPEPVRALYLLAGGSNWGDGIFGGWEWIELELIADHITELQISLESDNPDEAEAMTLVPVFSYNGDYLCVRHNEDCGRLYYVPHDNPTIEVVAETLTDYLEHFAARIASGALVLDQYTSHRGTSLSVRPPNREYWPPDFDLRDDR